MVGLDIPSPVRLVDDIVEPNSRGHYNVPVVFGFLERSFCGDKMFCHY
jgi:hypothetical protein